VPHSYLDFSSECIWTIKVVDQDRNPLREISWLPNRLRSSQRRVNKVPAQTGDHGDMRTLATEFARTGEEQALTSLERIDAWSRTPDRRNGITPR
jgi:hypothetical protein